MNSKENKMSPMEEYIKSKGWGIAYKMYSIAKNKPEMTIEEKHRIILEKILERAKKGYLCYLPNKDKSLNVDAYSFYDDVNDILTKEGFKIETNYSGDVVISWDFGMGF